MALANRSWAGNACLKACFEGHREGRAEGWAQGHEKGRAAGRAEGREEGERAKALTVARNLASLPDDAAIAAATGLSVEEVAQMRKEL